jgi:hypothetical protein
MVLARQRNVDDSYQIHKESRLRIFRISSFKGMPPFASKPILAELEESELK